MSEQRIMKAIDDLEYQMSVRNLPLLRALYNVLPLSCDESDIEAVLAGWGQRQGKEEN